MANYRVELGYTTKRGGVLRYLPHCDGVVVLHVAQYFELCLADLLPPGHLYL